MSTATDEHYLTTEEVAARYRTSPATIHGWTSKRSGPPSIRVGKRRLYRMGDLLRWEAEQRDDRRPDA